LFHEEKKEEEEVVGMKYLVYLEDLEMQIFLF
jgi:hypothetical protein